MGFSKSTFDDSVSGNPDANVSHNVKIAGIKRQLTVLFAKHRCTHMSVGVLAGPEKTILFDTTHIEPYHLANPSPWSQPEPKPWFKLKPEL